jgi:hypothetical protein
MQVRARIFNILIKYEDEDTPLYFSTWWKKWKKKYIASVSARPK